MLTQRQADILTQTIRTYIRGAHPVGSSHLVTDGKIELSPATVRNELMDLEDAGYLFQPHTSAGRVPTEKAWRYYLDHGLSERPVTPERQGELRHIVRAYQRSREELLKHLARTLAAFTSQAVFVAFGPRDTYYTGISKLFQQPEFEELDLVRNISQVVDHLDEIMPRLFEAAQGEVTVLLGRESHVGGDCSLILARLNRPSLIGVLGPIRQDYDGTVPLLRFTRSLITE